jgi:Domain of unknown function (DUF4179)
MLNEDNNLKKRLNDSLHHINPPSSLHNDIRQRIITDNASKKVTKSIKNMVAASTIALLILLLFGSGFVSPTLANVLHKLPIVGHIYTDYKSDIGLQKAQEAGLTEEYQKTVISKDVEVTLTKIYYDGVNLSIGYKIISNTSKEWPDPPAMGAGASHFLILKGSHEFKINGSNMFGGLSDTFKEIDPGEYEGLLQLHANEFPKENNFVLECFFSEIQGVKGEWNFKVPVTKEKVKEIVHSFEPNHKVDALGGEIIVKRVDFTPTAIGLETETIRRLNKENKDDVLLFSIVEVGADNGVSGDSEKLENGKTRIITRSTFPPLKEVPEFITVRGYNPSDLSESVQFKVPLKKE